ncbi:hypothetical protein [Streptomyces sp. NPDC057854]|uniref:hypothetical protein n=1 Tax=unclassified Streptomyces TaxID=2593676 RepID=UPI0036C235FD
MVTTTLEGSPGPGPWYLWLAAPLVAAALGAGFAALGRRGAFVKSVLGTLALFGLAVWLDAGTAPALWTVLYAAWAGLLAWALIRALRRPSPTGFTPPLPQERRRALVAAGLGLALAVGGLAGLRFAADTRLAEGDAAQLAGDCATALERYAGVEGALNEYTLGAAPVAARTGRSACVQTLLAERADGTGDHEGAESAYRRATVAFTARFGTGAPRLAALRLAHGDAMVTADRRRLAAADPGAVGRPWFDAEAVTTYRSIVRDTPHTPEAALVPARIDTLYAQITGDAAKRPCVGLGRLLGLATLDGAKEPGAEPVTAKARAALPEVRYACGASQYREKRYREARATLKEVTTGPYAKKAADLLIAVDVADAAQGIAGALPPPATEGPAPAGTTELVVANDSTKALEVLYAGPENGTAEIEACVTCTTRRTLPTSHLGGRYDTCSSSARTVTLRLKPGTYDLVVRGAGSTDVRPYTGRWSLKPGTAYSSCFYISSGLY